MIKRVFSNLRDLLDYVDLLIFHCVSYKVDYTNLEVYVEEEEQE